MTKSKITLASSSPRRIEMPKLMGFDVQVTKPEIEESPLPREKPKAMVKRLAREKAAAIYPRSKRPVVIAADTIVVAPNGKILGKPKNAKDAVRALTELCGRIHQVHTGYCLLGLDGNSLLEVVRVVTTSVKMRELSRSEIQAYVASGEPLDRAGSYAIQGLAMAFVESIRGSHANVVGLPISEVVSDLKEHFGISAL